ncbi:MAG: helix-turn-helix domain-containing protein [Pseudobutyrivibrio sp.]|nr:helix-turn-helix domain-containing protein [Pseudobutyrivibrio sp.]
MFCRNLCTLRKKKGITQEMLANRLGVVRQTISKWEKGLSLPDAEMLIHLADLLDSSVEELLGTDIKLPDTNEDDEVRNKIAEQLAMTNELLAEKNRRTKLIWKYVGRILLILLLFTIFYISFFITF